MTDQDNLKKRLAAMKADNITLLGVINEERARADRLEDILLEIVGVCEARVPPNPNQIKTIALWGLGNEHKD